MRDYPRSHGPTTKRTCNECFVEKAFQDFHQNRKGLFGRLSKCAQCCNKKRLIKNLSPELKERRKISKSKSYYNRSPETKQKQALHNKNYRLSIKDKMKSYWTKYRAKNKTKEIAWTKVKLALKNGTLIKMQCEFCGSLKINAHHSDYSQPLNVRWLCHNHHKQVHRGVNYAASKS